MPVEVEYIHDGEWARVGSLMVYPRDDDTSRKPTTYSIGRIAGARCWQDLDRQIGFENMQAAIDQAAWLVETPDILRQVW